MVQSRRSSTLYRLPAIGCRVVDGDRFEKHFARGVVFKVAKGTDILDVAIVMSRDDKDTLKNWIDEGKVNGAEIEDAKKWHESSASLWTVVIAPWVLVQEIEIKLDS